LREDEHVVPQRSLLAALQLREIDVRPRTTLQERTRVVVEEETEVEERRRDRRPVDPNVALLQVPPPWPDDQRRHTLVQAIDPPIGTRVLERPPHGILDVCLAAHHVRPVRRKCILQVHHEDPGTGVERVDHHLAVRRTRDLDTSVLKVRRRWCHLPRPSPRLRPITRAVREPARRSLRPTLPAAREERTPPILELPVQRAHEIQRLRRQYALTVVSRRRFHPHFPPNDWLYRPSGPRERMGRGVRHLPCQPAPGPRFTF